MNITIILLGFVGFCTFICIHVVVWRWFRPKRDYITLILIFFIVFLSYFIIPHLGLLKKLNVEYNFIDWVLVFFLYFVLASAYIVTYPAIQAISPSLKIVLLAGDSMPNGVTVEQIKVKFNTNELLDLKIQDLINSKLVAEENGFLKLTVKGFIMIILFIFLRKILGASMGRGQMELKLRILILLFCSPFLIIFMQAMFLRIFKHASNQIVTLLCGIIGNLPIIVIVFAIDFRYVDSASAGFFSAIFYTILV